MNWPCKWLYGLFILSLMVKGTCANAQWTDRDQIQAQKMELQKQRDAILSRYDLSSRQCWQQFMVNDCLQSARAQRRVSLEAVEKQEQTLRAAQRALTSQEREERLQAKQPNSEVLHDPAR